MSTTPKGNVRVDTELEIDGEPPYFYSPYPNSLVQIKEPETKGESNIIQLINDNWPKPIDELEELSEKYNGNGGYSGSFIRNVLRNFYIPEDPFADEAAHDVEEIASQEYESAYSPEEETWHKVFRLGIRTAFEEDITENQAVEAFGSGFIEGVKLKEEMEQ